MQKKYILLFLLTTTLFGQKIVFEVLGSGGPEIDGRASASYIIWIDEKARILIDAGSGSMLRFEQSGAKLEDLDVIVLTHLHIDHCVDLPSYIKAGYFSSRQTSLPIIGPGGNWNFPDIQEFLSILFGSHGAYRYMSDVLETNSDSFQIYPVEVDSSSVVHKEYKHFSLDLVNTHHGNVPAIALRVNIGDKSILVSGDTNNKNHSLEKLATDVNLFVAHHAIPEHASGYATKLHMTPSIIADVAQKAKVKELLLSHRMKRTIGHEKETLKIIQKKYTGKVVFAEDRMKIEL